MGFTRDALHAINDFLHRPWVQPFAWLFIWSSVLISAPLGVIGLWGLFIWDFIQGRIFRRVFIPASRDTAILVTGCDSGFGSLIAVELAEKGFKVYAGCLTEKAINELGKVEGITALKMDVTKKEDIDRVVSKIGSECPAGLHSLINNAGVGQGALLEWSDMDHYRFHMEVNFFAKVAVTRACIPLLKEAKGRVVNITSLAGLIPGEPCMSAYSASKHAADSFTQSIRMELGWWGIHVVNVNPGFHATAIHSNGLSSFKNAYHKQPSEVQALFGDKFIKDCERYTALKMFPPWNPRHVVDALVHATTNKYPKDQYIVGWDAQYNMMILRCLPQRVYFWVTNKVIGRDRIIPAAADPSMKTMEQIGGEEELKYETTHAKNE